MPDLYRVRLSADVLHDLEQIYAHIAKDSPAAAGRMIEKLLDAIDSLEILPHRNIVERQSPKLKYPVRSLVVPPYVVYFRVIDDDRIVLIRHIRHGARRPPKRFD
ncbi:MAG TPA: type II toxin-antitoxin system RelE/ParE family toxin [Humisphaera sp.]|jgi:plasmid stabilization system protein ParE|nr:type II toxin-antitoxin system RelE/ParE family toxin [Humisphaera sp.]